MTPARTAILSLFSSNCRPLRAEDIYGKLRKKKIDRVTVYRTLALFEKERLVKQVDLRRDSIYYEPVKQDHHHHHIICKNCRTVEDFDLCNIERVSKKVLKLSNKFASVMDHSLELFGYCKTCAS